MPAVQELYCVFGSKPKQLSQIENIFLEATLFTRVCEKLKKIYKDKNKDFFRLIKVTKEMEEEMLETNFMRCVVNDILQTEEYTIDGIACYTGSPEEVIQEIIVGLNTSPSLKLARRIIELHRTIRPDLYKEILNKIIYEEMDKSST